MTKLLSLVVIIAALVLIASPAARQRLRRDLPSLLLYGVAAVAILLVVTGRAHWLFAAAGGLLALGRRLLPWAWQLPALAGLWRRWRSRGEAEDTAGSARDGHAQREQAGAMTPDEARETLGVSSDAPESEIIAAHRRLMQRVHPDRGGSAALARRLNEARAVLLGSRSGETAAG